MTKENLASRLRASPWMGLFARVLLLATALAVLAWIGRVATAHANASSTLVTVDAGDVDAAPPPPAEAPAPAQVSDPPPAPPTTKGRATPDTPVFLNTADEAELRRLPGCGAKRAEAILQLRRRVGRFHRVEDLMRVKGIGRAAIKKWRPLVRLEDPDGGVAR